MDETALLETIHSYMEDIHPAYNRDDMEKIARVYIDCIDKEGFVFDFDHAWAWAGYSRKDAAKRQLKHLRKGIDYQITQPAARANAPAKVLHTTEEGNTRANEVVQNGGQNREKIMLTARGMNAFALCAKTPVGQTLRDFVLELVRGMKRLATAVATGEVVMQRRRASDERDVKRIKTCETTKALMAEVAGRTAGNLGVICAKMNGNTNKAVTGRYRYETAKLLGKKPKQVNARDYMTPEQLSVAETCEMLSRKALRDNPDADPLATHARVCTAVTSDIGDMIHGEIAINKRTLTQARKTPMITK